jgi:hypothetical protein
MSHQDQCTVPYFFAFFPLLPPSFLLTDKGRFAGFAPVEAVFSGMTIPVLLSNIW